MHIFLIAKMHYVVSSLLPHHTHIIMVGLHRYYSNWQNIQIMVYMDHCKSSKMGIITKINRDENYRLNKIHEPVDKKKIYTSISHLNP